MASETPIRKPKPPMAVRILVVEDDEEMRELILVGASGLELRRRAIDDGMITLRQSGLRKVKDGLTTVEEVVRETIVEDA